MILDCEVSAPLIAIKRLDLFISWYKYRLKAKDTGFIFRAYFSYNFSIFAILHSIIKLIMLFRIAIKAYF